MQIYLIFEVRIPFLAHSSPDSTGQKLQNSKLTKNEPRANSFIPIVKFPSVNSALSAWGGSQPHLSYVKETLAQDSRTKIRGKVQKRRAKL